MTNHSGIRNAAFCRITWLGYRLSICVMILASGTWRMPGVGAWPLGSEAKAAEVDASGAAAPVGFAESLNG